MTGTDNNSLPYVSVSCADYEHLELACMDRYRVDVVTDDGTIRGLAVTTDAKNGSEFFTIELDDRTHQSVRLDYIRKIVVLSGKRRFDEWVFEGPLGKAGE